MKKKVAVILHGLGANGIDTLFANLSRHWDYSKIEITYFLAVDGDEKQFWEDVVVQNGVRVIHLHDLDKNRVFLWPFTLYRVLKKYGPFDVVHLNMDMLNGINCVIAKLAAVPVRICHAHRSSSEDETSKVKKTYIAIMRFLTKLFATGKLACSDLAGQYFFGSDFEIVYNGIEIDKYSPSSIDLTERKQQDPTFVTVGRFTEQKNPFFLAEVFREILKKKPRAKLLWIGNGNLFDAVKQKVEQLGMKNEVSFLGIRKDVYDIYKMCNYFILPSLFEGLSLSLAEAQAAQLDCFVSDTVSKMSDCGKCKFIPLEVAPEQWANEICSHIDKEKKMFLDEERLSRFDIKYTAKKLEECYFS